ncbi:hypothetical protein [Bacillus sp. Marseille-P3661]|uniref:hypothetical protein n=1 Tax=Bacillus sp. Marseille-P3661 TaxID=1936234 RepID=UPI0015E15F85|nr:hypothetical protein [Bacillus sp. Marseille-P3661]
MLQLIATIIGASIVLVILLFLPIKVTKQNLLMIVGVSLFVALLFNLMTSIYSISLAAITMIVLLVLLTILFGNYILELDQPEVEDIIETNHNQTIDKELVNDIDISSINQSRIDDYINSLTKAESDKVIAVNEDVQKSSSIQEETERTVADSIVDEDKMHLDSTQLSEWIPAQEEFEKEDSIMVEKDNAMSNSDLVDLSLLTKQENEIEKSNEDIPDSKLKPESKSILDEEMENDIIEEQETSSSFYNSVINIDIDENMESLFEDYNQKIVNAEVIELPINIENNEMNDNQVAESDDNELLDEIVTEEHLINESEVNKYPKQDLAVEYLLHDIEIQPEPDVEELPAKVNPSQYEKLLTDLGDIDKQEDLETDTIKDLHTKSETKADVINEKTELKAGEKVELNEENRDIINKRKALFKQLEDDLF